MGLADTAVKESRERIRAALRHVGFPLPGKNVVVNLAPADLPKAGTALDLAAALSILAANGDVPAEALAHVTLLGELALDGALRPVPGVLAVAETAVRAGTAGAPRPRRRTPPKPPRSGTSSSGPVTHLGAAIAHVCGRETLPGLRRYRPSPTPPLPSPSTTSPTSADRRSRAAPSRSPPPAATTS